MNRRWRSRAACTVAAAGIAATGVASVAWAKPGWSTASTSYLGRYHVIRSGASGPEASGEQPAGAPSGLFAGLVRAARAVAAPAASPASVGELTIFMRPVKMNGQDVDVPSGILAFHDARSTSVYYLMDLAHHGHRRTATLVGGAFDGPHLGSLRATTSRPGRLAGTMRLGHATSRLRFVRFSTNPHP